ncbi:MAG: DNA-processing protein DprA [Flavobacteriales bacterium]|nr:DNA-processing protein DprA [Flavobacteriales bacterium]MDG2246721.1 DNA-processing protein DprA [Flavobacteriales bacterium]
MKLLDELIAKVALARADRMGPATAQKLVERFGDPLAIFQSSNAELRDFGCHDQLIRGIRDEVNWRRAGEEILEVQNEGGEVISKWEPNYPEQLKRCLDAPIFLYVKGSFSGGMKRCLSIVGTRRSTEYGKKVCERMVAELAKYDVTIVSGLAFGIDILAHRAALNYGLPTIACLAHGLDRIYPSVHASDARKMLETGGWITEFPPNRKPKRENFPSRNRIIAGLSEATVVVESNVKGGSMITARIAASYNRDVFAVPGNVFDASSEGPNFLIQNMEAQLFSSVSKMALELGWENRGRPKKQLRLLLDLDENEQRVVDLLSQRKTHISSMEYELGWTPSTLSMVLLNLELKSLIRLCPGQCYELIH